MRMYVTHKREDGTFQPLKEHLINVAEHAGSFAQSIHSPQEGKRAGLLHDIGKYSEKGQARQRDPEHTARVDHASAGVQEAGRLGDMQAAFAIAGHHGGLPDSGKEEGTLGARFRKRLDGANDPAAWKTELDIPKQTDIPLWVMKEPISGAMYTRMLFSCLVDADFLDTETALQGPQPRGGYADMETLLQRLRAKVLSWLQTPRNELCLHRNEILMRCSHGGEDAQGLYTLTVPTGGGKTVASLAFALSHAKAHNMKRIIYVIPYTSIIEQTAGVFREILGEENVLEHHSQAEFQEEQDADNTEALRRRLACENWDAPVIVTTAVQFFESMYAAKTSRCRKLHNIAQSVMIFDEAQTMPLSLLLPCVSAIAELVRHYDATAVLCTATQPALDRLFASCAPKLKIRELAPDPDGLFEFFRRVRFVQEGLKSDVEVAEQLASEQQVLCITNSRKRARAIYQMLPEEGRFHLSTLMMAEDRERTLVIIRERLKQGEPCRVVSTSLVEAGVDVDFPTVWREMAGLDSILQAAGRCNREGKNDPAKSLVHIFIGEGRMSDDIRLRAATTEKVLKAYGDINTREAITAYFLELMGNVGEKCLDTEGILQMEANLLFRSVAKKFKVIKDDSLTVYIPTDDNAENIRKMRHGEYSKGLLRRLGRTAVNIPQYEFEALVKAGVVESYAEDGFGILLNPDAYSRECGLDVHCEDTLLIV